MKSEKHPLKNMVILLDANKKAFVLSPLRLMITLALCIFIVETLVMIVLEFFEPPKRFETLIDSTVLTATLFAILYYDLFKPLVILIKECRSQEIELKNHQEHLARMVEERTAELNTAYLELKEENEKTLNARAALRESEDRFRQIFEQSEDAIVLISPQDNTIIDVNPTAERIFRKQRNDLLTGGLSALCDPEGYLLLASAIDQIIQNDSPGMIEKLECQLGPDDLHILSFHGKKISLQGIEVIYTTFRDITMRIRLEEQAQEIQARLIHANRMTSLGTMVSSVAHEINNPNNFLLMNARIIKHAWEDIAPVVENHYLKHGDFAVVQTTWSEARNFLPEAIEGIQQGASRISDIVGNLKDFGRDDRFRPEARADVNAVVQLSASILNHHISRATRRFQLELAEGLQEVRGSSRQLEQVVINLIQNALQALPSPDRGILVTTGIDTVSGHILIQVIDEGNGIPAELAARIMEPFFTTRLEHGGTGLGLAISSSIVREYGGSIEFASDPGKGTIFTVRLCPVGDAEKMNDQRGMQ